MKTTINLPDDIRDRLEAHMIRTGATLNKTVAIALDHYLYSLEREQEASQAASARFEKEHPAT